MCDNTLQWWKENLNMMDATALKKTLRLCGEEIWSRKIGALSKEELEDLFKLIRSKISESKDLVVIDD